MYDDLSDPARSVRGLQKRVERLPVAAAAGGDSGHAGAGDDSIMIGEGASSAGIVSVGIGYGATASGAASAAYGVNAEAEESYGAALGPNTHVSGISGTAVGDSATVEGLRGASFGYGATADGQQGMALGSGSYSGHAYSSAIGTGAETTAENQLMLGTAGDEVNVPGTLVNPSARKLKCEITDAPLLRDVFPSRYEWQYKADPTGRRRLGPMADDLVGTEAERFVIFDDDGEVAGIDRLGLHEAQIAALHEENVELRAIVADLAGAVAELRALLSERP